MCLMTHDSFGEDGQNGVRDIGTAERLLCQFGDSLSGFNGIYLVFQGLIRSISHPSKSGVFLVATTAP